MIALGVDVGGTNTDIILSGLERGAGTLVHKLPSTPHDSSIATVQGSLEACELAGIRPAEVGLILHGTTVATNALLEHDGARTGMLTTAGFRDIIHIGRHRRPHNFSLMQDIPIQRWPLVERKHRKPVAERVVPPGVVQTPLDEEQAARAVEELKAAGVDSICVCFLFSFLNPENELRAGQIVRELHPEADVSLSHQVIAQFREFERFTTTAVNAFVKPKVRRYLERLEAGYREAGFGAPLRIMQSNGGVADVGNAAERPVNVLLSGPAAGVIAGKHLGDLHGYANLITLDIGGTSADISVIPGRLLELNPLDTTIAGYPVLAPKLDVTAIGAGGGSIAWADQAGAFNVGPKSAGADPGPRATAAAAPSRRSPTRTSCSAASTRRTSSAAACGSTRPSPGRGRADRAALLDDGGGGGARDPHDRRTRTWCARCASTRSAAATTRASACSSRSAARARCTPARSRPSSRSPRSSCRPRRASPRRWDCSRPICATTSCARSACSSTPPTSS